MKVNKLCYLFDSKTNTFKWSDVTDVRRALSGGTTLAVDQYDNRHLRSRHADRHDKYYEFFAAQQTKLYVVFIVIIYNYCYYL